MTESKKMDNVKKVDKKRIPNLPRDRGRALGRELAERARIKKAKLRVVCFHIPEEKWKRFKVNLARHRLTVRQVTEAMVDCYNEGGFNVEETSNQADKK
jgi:hypothetical protein